MINRYPKIIKSKVFFDKRGYLQEIYKRKNFKDNFKFAIFVSSKKNVFRGLHFQKKLQQEKIVVVVKGAMEDPLSTDEVETKERPLLEMVIGKDKTDKLIDTIWNLESLGNVRDLRELLRP